MADDESALIGPEIPLPRAFFTQTDWAGNVSIETWYGRHSPWRRIFAFMVLSSWSWTLVTVISLFSTSLSSSFVGSDSYLASLGKIPILHARTKREIETIKLSHWECFDSLCEEVGRLTPIDCVVNDDGITSRVEYRKEDVQDPIHFPEACHQATEVTFGDRYLDGFPEEDVPPVAFISLSTDSKGKVNNETTTSSGTSPSMKSASLLTLLPDCSVMISDPDVSPAELQAIKDKFNINVGGTDWNDLYEEFQQQQQNEQQQQQPLDISLSFDLMQFVHGGRGHPRGMEPGYREKNVLKNALCVDEMPPDIQQQALPQLVVLYNFLMDYRTEIITVVLYMSNLCFSCATVAWLMFRLIIPSMVMRRVLAWPENIGFIDIWRTLLLLCVTTGYSMMSPVLAGVSALGSWWYGNSRSFWEWSFLGVVAWAATDTIYPYLDDLVGHLQLDRLDGLNIFYWTIHLFVVGEGWWKLITVYVVYRSYEALFRRTASFQAPPPPPLQQTQIQLQQQKQQQQQQQENGGSIQQQQQQQQQPAPPQDHIKAD